MVNQLSYPLIQAGEKLALKLETGKPEKWSLNGHNRVNSICFRTETVIRPFKLDICVHKSKLGLTEYKTRSD